VPVKTKALPVRSAAEVFDAYPQHRQSLLSEADECMLRTKWRLEVAESYDPEERHDRAWDTAEAARGILAHRYAAAILRTLWETGETQIPVAEALEVLYEVCEQRDVPDADVVYLPARERRLLRMFAVRLVSQRGRLRTWRMDRLLSVEERLWGAVSYTAPDGSTVKRTITGQPDAVLADPSDGVVVLDWKTTPKAPAAPNPTKANDEGDFYGDDVPGNVSYEGYFQQRVYGLLELANRPNITKVTLREVYPLDPDGLQVRKATVYRDDLERIERELGTVVQLLDRALAGGSGSKLWKPQPGKHCSHCPRPGACPIPREERRQGAVSSLGQAQEWAADAVVAKSVYEHRRVGLRAFHEQTGIAIPVESAKGRWEWSFAPGSRNFGMRVPAESDRAPDDRDLADVFRRAAERKRSAA
jgi:hypothetical protein